MAKKLMANVADSGLFLREWLANPLRTGAVAPSSRKLATAMAKWLPKDPDEFVLELGPGTGAVTDALLAHGLREDRLIAIENNPTLGRLLRKRFSQAKIIIGDAWKMDALVQGRNAQVPRVGAVISSLPLLNFPPEKAEALAEKIKSILFPGGHWVQYTYHLGKKHPRGSDRFHLLSSKIVWINLPPARVSVYTKPH